MRVLEELWHGNINDNSKFLRYNARLTKMLNLLSRNANNLTENLSEKEEVFEKYKDCSAEISEITECENFIKKFFRLYTLNSGDARCCVSKTKALFLIHRYAIMCKKQNCNKFVFWY